MYTDFYGLSTLPFQLTPDPRFFFGSTVHNRAVAHLTYGLGQGEGFIIITGDVGAGKTTLVGHLFATLDQDRYVAAKIVTTQLDADDMLRMVASAFGIATDGADKASLLRKLEALLGSIHAQGRRALLVVDEAQNLSVKALEELRMLSNFQVEEKTPLQCFLLGQPQFRATLAAPELDQLRQRVIVSYHLGPLSPEETRNYVEHRLALAGWKHDPTFSDAAFERIYVYTHGVPRMINTLCSRLLLFGFLEEVHKIDDEIVEQVAEEHAQETSQILDEGEEAGAEAAMRRYNNGHGTARHVNGQPDLTEIVQRLSVLEEYVGLHERILKKALRIAVQYLEGRREDGRETHPS